MKMNQRSSIEMVKLRVLERTRPAHYPRAFAKNVKVGESLRRQVPVHPAHFVVGMEEDNRPLYPEGLPEGIVEGTAISCTSYVARVDEVSARGEVSVTLWERPNGREGLTTLVGDGKLWQERPEAGDLLWIWTWTDVVDGKTIEKIHVEIERAELTEEDRAYFEKLLLEMQSDKR